MKKVIVPIIFLLLALTLFGCVTGDKYHTYVLKGAPLNRETDRKFIFWLTSYDYYNQVIKLPNTTNNAREYQSFDFSIWAKGSFERGTVGDRTTYTEPYRLWIESNPYDAQVITVNKLTFKSRDKDIDLRKTVGVSYRVTKSFDARPLKRGFSEEELIDFRNSGKLDLSSLEHDIYTIYNIIFEYDNVDVAFNKDMYFDIECDITFESDIEGSEAENYTFTARFNKKKYFGEKMSLLTFLFLW
jgi:hypothetical protein